jgi:ribosome recycling factor
MLDKMQKDAEQRMQKAIDAFKNELNKVRTGRAHPSLLDAVRVPYYGNETPLSQIATINVSDARTLMVTPWEKQMIPAIEKAIMSAALGLNPVTSGDAMRVPLPAMNEERRREMIKLVRQVAEAGRVALRNIRRDANTTLKEVLKKKEISEDDERRMQETVQKLTDKYIAEIDKLVHGKEAELLEV